MEETGNAGIMNVQVYFFAVCREKAGTDHVTLELPEGATGQTLWKHLLERFPTLAPYRPQCRLAVNQAYVPDATPLQSGDEIAIIPPVSGG